MKNDKKYIGVYTDKSADYHILRDSVQAYAQTIGLEVVDIKAQHILNDQLDSKHIPAFFMPGAINGDHYEQMLVNSPAKKKLYNYVASGGTLSTVCASSYSLCENTRFKMEKNGETKTRQGLGFFKATAIGQLDDLIHPDYPRIKDMYRQAVTTVTFGDNQSSEVLYWGGPTIEEFHQDPDIEVLARYKNLPHTPIAMAKKQIELGATFFSGVHFEVSGAQLKAGYQELQKANKQNKTSKTSSKQSQARDFGIAVAETLIEVENSRLELFHFTMNEIMTPYFKSVGIDPKNTLKLAV